MDGQVLRVVRDKGFGFLAGKDGVERFFHSSQLKNATWDTVREGDRVTFDPDKGPKGDRALNVQLQD